MVRTLGAGPSALLPSVIFSTGWRGNNSASSALISVAHQEARSSSRLRRSQAVTSSLHLLALQEPQAGAMLSSV